MKKLFQCVKNEGILFFACALCAAAFVSCASAPKPAEPEPDSAVHEVEEAGTKLPGTALEPRARAVAYFSRIDSAVLADAEVASPSSLRRAVSALRRAQPDDDASRVLLTICSHVMQLAWPAERIDWEVPAVSSENAYYGVINSARNGIYDMSTGNMDFFSTLLPSLVLLKVQDVSDFYSLSEASLKKALEMRPDSVLAEYLLGMLYAKQGEYAPAVQHLKEAARLSPESLEPSYSYVRTLRDAGRMTEAGSAIQTLLAKYPSERTALRLGAEISYSLKNYNRAEEYISKVLQQDPNDLPSVLFRAQILVEKKDYIHAASLLDMYSRQDNSSKEYLLLRAQVQMDWSKNTTAAISTIEKALRSYPSDTGIQLFAARLCAATNLPVAGKSLEQYAASVLQNEPENETALMYAVQGYMRNKDWENAYAVSASLVAKPTATVESRYNHVKVCIAVKRYDEAWNLASSLYRSNSGDEVAAEYYVLAMVESGRSVQALSTINQLLASASSHLKSFLYYERSFLQTSDDATLSDLRSSLMANPRNSDSLFRLYKIYLARKDYRKAQYYLKQVVALNPNDTEIRRLNDELNALIR